MPEFVRVRDKDTKHEYSVVDSAVDPAAHEVLKEPGAEPDGSPIPPKHYEAPAKTSAGGQGSSDKKES